MIAPVKTKYCDEICRFQWGKYASGQIALQLYGPEGPEMTVTTNMPEEDIEEDEIVVKDYSENEGIYDELVRLGVVKSIPVRLVRSGHVHLYVLKLKIKPEN
jgi:hypothetical protein